MSTSLMYFTQGIRGFQHESFDFSRKHGTVYQKIVRKDLRCPECNGSKVTAKWLRTRDIKGVKSGRWQLCFIIDVHRIYCHECGSWTVEKLPFLSSSKSRITKELERSIVELRSEMSINAVAGFFDLPWRTVKNVEKRHLKKKYHKIELKNVRIIGIDEIFVSRKKGVEKYLTIVRDLESGAVLYVGKGKGVDALKNFTAKLKRAKTKIAIIAMDMSKAYTAWAGENLPDAEIVFDHFHVIKLMNEKLDKVRRRITANLDEEHRKLLKNQRFLFLRNVENLSPDAKLLLDNLRKTFRELGEVSMMKEALRSIYRQAGNEFRAKAALRNWCDIARETDIKELSDMAKTIENHLGGITAYWRTDKLSNAAMEGFNNKVRWLIRQAYGYRDQEYFHLKIFDLPNIDTNRKL
jgi:transposase